MTPEVILAELRGLASLGLAMRKAQRAYFDRRKAMPHVPADAEYRAARELEKRFDAAARDAISTDRQQLPGMEGGAI